MPKRFQRDHSRQPDLVGWSDVPRFYWIAMGVAIFLGLVGGSLFIAWKLFQLHVLQ